MSDVALPEQGQPQINPSDYDLPDHGEVRKLWDDTRKEMRVANREYSLNRAFDRGDQYIRWDAVTVDAMVREFRTAADSDSRTIVNLFRSRRRSLTARLTATELGFQVRASSNDDAGMRRQRLCVNVLESLRTRQQWERLRAQNVNYTMRGGNAAIAWEWDPTSTNAPHRIDPVSGALLPAGGVKLRALSVADFGLEPGSASQEDATWWVMQTSAPPEQVQSTYRMKDKPSADAFARQGPMSRLIASRRGEANQSMDLTTIHVYSRRPTAMRPGVVAHYVNDRIAAWTPWPYPHEDYLNLYVFSCDDPDETWLTDPWLSDARPVQQMYNDVRSTIREHAQRAGNARILSPAGALDDPTVMTDAPGEIIEFNGDRPPEWMKGAEVPRWLVGEVDRLMSELNDLLAQPDVSRGVAPGDRNSGSALALLAEKADGPLGPFARDQARGWGVVTTNVLRLLRHNMQDGEQRQTTAYTDSGVPSQLTWTKEDIAEDVEVLVPLETTVPRSHAALRAQLVDLQQSFPAMFQNVDPVTFSKMLGLGTIQQIIGEAVPGQAFVTWENERLAAGVIVTPDEWHNHNLHIGGHESWRNSASYEEAEPEIQDLFDSHIDAHKAIAAEMAAEAMARQQQAQMQQMMALPPGGDTEDAEDAESPQEVQSNPGGPTP